MKVLLVNILYVKYVIKYIPNLCIAIPFKRAFSEENSSTDWSWNSSNKSKKTKLLKIYLSSVYSETDFGGADDQSIRVSLY